MPELPEVETVRTALQRALSGRVITKLELLRPDLRTPFPPRFVQTLKGRSITGVLRRSKYLLITLDGGVTWLAHLGMTGSFASHGVMPKVPKKHDHVRLWLDDGALIYTDPRRFGMMDVTDTVELHTHPWLKHLGPEPLEAEFTPAYLAQALSRRSGAIKPVLMDAKLVVGVGNIYASEALFAAKIHPDTPANRAVSQAKTLHGAIQQVLHAAIASGGSSLKDFVHIDGKSGYFQHHFAVYGREGEACMACATPIKRSIQAGRSTFFCPSASAEKPKSFNRIEISYTRAKAVFYPLTPQGIIA